MRVAAVCLVVLAGAVSETAAQERQRIPLRVGLTIVKAVEMTQGDAESIDRIDRIDATGIHIKWAGDITSSKDEGGISSGDNPLSGLLSGIVSVPASTPATPKPRAGKPSRLSGTRTVRRVDLASARHYYTLFAAGQPAVYPGSTSLGTSTLVLGELRTKGEATFSCQCAPELFTSLGALAGAMSRMSGSSKELEEQGKLSGTLRRVGATSVPFPVVVNDIATRLPVIYARGKLGEEDAEFWFLDDDENPLALKAQVGPNGFQVVKISFPSEESAPRIAKSLEETGRVEVYGIYFDFGSATIRAESEPVLKEIAEALASNPAWKLNVEGHTDNVGDDDANLELSRKRADAVKQALVSRFRVDGSRLGTAGFGATRPREMNESVAGRARNRRVELVRR